MLRAGTVVYPDVQLGERVQTGHHTVIRSDTVVGSDVVLGTNIVIEGTCRIGDRVKLQSYVLHTPQYDDRVRRVPRSRRDADQRQADGGVRARHLPARPQAARSDDSPRRAHRRNAVILPEIEIGATRWSVPGAVVTHDVAPGVVVVGVPARPIGTVPAAHRVVPRARTG